MVVAKKVKKPVHRKMGEMMGEWLVLGVGFPRDRLLGENDVADEWRPWPRWIPARERQHIRGCIDAAPLRLSEADRRIIGQEDSKLRPPLLTAAVAACADRPAQQSSAPCRVLSTGPNSTLTSIWPHCSARHSICALRALALARRRLVVGLDDARDQLMADHVRGREGDVADAFDAFEQPHRSARPEVCPGGKSTWLGSPVTTMRLFSPSRVSSIFICIAVVFCASSRMIAAFDNVRPRMKASGAISISRGLQRAFDDARIHQVVERVIDRPQIRIDLFAHVAGQKAKPLAGFHRRAATG